MTSVKGHASDATLGGALHLADWSESRVTAPSEGTLEVQDASDPQQQHSMSRLLGTWGSAFVSGLHATGLSSGASDQGIVEAFFLDRMAASTLLQAVTASSPGAEITSVNLSTRIRLRRIARESRERGEDTPVDEAVERRAETLLERVWGSSLASDEAFTGSTFVTITGDGAVQFEWESEAMLIEATVEPRGGFTIYVHRERGGTVEHYPELIEEAVKVIERGWGGARRAAGGV